MLAVCASCASPPPLPADPTPAFAHAVAPLPSPTAVVLWTAPPMSPPGPTATAAPAAPAPATAAPAPSASPAPRPSPTAPPDPFKWSGYRIDGGPVLYVPASWTVFPPASLQGVFRFAASPEAQRGSSIGGYATLLTLSYLSVTPSMSVDAFADTLARTFPASAQPLREPGTHPSGPVVFLKYPEPASGGKTAQHVDAILVVRGKAYILGARSPMELWPRFAPTFMQVFQRFGPA